MSLHEEAARLADELDQARAAANSADPFRFSLRERLLLADAAALLRQISAPAAEVRCALCGYQHGHAIGCENNPVDIALRAPAAEVPMPDSDVHLYMNEKDGMYREEFRATEGTAPFYSEEQMRAYGDARVRAALQAQAVPIPWQHQHPHNTPSMADKAGPVARLAKEMNRYFTSGNRVPVEKATIPADEWNALYAALQAQAVPVAWMDEFGNVELSYRPWMNEEPGTKWFPLYRHPTPTGEQE